MKKLVQFSLILIVLTSTHLSYSQDEPIEPCGPGIPPEECGQEDPFNVPFDGGISLLIAGGAVLGIAKLKKKKETN